MNTRFIAAATIVGILGCLTAPSSLAQAEQFTPAQTQASALHAARAAVNANPQDAQAHMQLGDALRHAGRNREAAQEYLAAANLQQDLYVAYHQLSQICNDREVLDEAVAKLTAEKEQHPQDLMLRVALSELLEKEKQYYAAAKPLIELQYANTVPRKYGTKVEARVHYLLSKAKQAQLKEQDQPIATDEELDIVPAPLPDSNLRKGLTASKIKDSKELKGMGHVPLLP